MFSFYNITSDDITVNGVTFIPGDNSLTQTQIQSVMSDTDVIAYLHSHDLKVYCNGQAIDYPESYTILSSFVIAANWPKSMIQKVSNTMNLLRPRCWVFDSAANTTTTSYFLMDADLSFRGGNLFSNGQLGDTLTLSVHDKDNILGGGAVDLKVYINGLAIFPNQVVELVDVDVSNAIPTGLYFKVDYTNTHATNSARTAINFLSYEADS